MTRVSDIFISYIASRILMATYVTDFTEYWLVICQKLNKNCIILVKEMVEKFFFKISFLFWWFSVNIKVFFDNKILITSIVFCAILINFVEWSFNKNSVKTVKFGSCGELKFENVLLFILFENLINYYLILDGPNVNVALAMCWFSRINYYIIKFNFLFN